MLTVADMGEGGVKNHQKSADVLYGRSPLQNRVLIGLTGILRDSFYYCSAVFTSPLSIWFSNLYPCIIPIGFSTNEVLARETKVTIEILWIFMERELRFGLDLGQLAVLKKRV